MLYKEGKKFIFVHIPKNAGNTIRQSILKLPNEDIKLVSHIENGIEYRGVINEHLTYDEHLHRYKEYDSEKIFSFCLIRNPLERFISIYNYLSDENFLNSGSKARRKTTELFLEMGNPLDALVYLKRNNNHPFFEDRHGYLQSEYIGKNKKVDYIGTVENFEKSINFILSKLNLDFIYSPQKLNEGTGKHLDLLTNEKYVELINYIYGKDIELYNQVVINNN